MMKIQVEFLGVFRLAAGTREMTLQIEEDTSFRDLIKFIAEKYPAMDGNMLAGDTGCLLGSNALNYNGRRMIQKEELDECLHDGDQITLMSILAGG
jgi:molybdopterin converting factor small subunit